MMLIPVEICHHSLRSGLIRYGCMCDRQLRFGSVHTILFNNSVSVFIPNGATKAVSPSNVIVVFRSN